jgi:hypothetical protein
MPHERRTEAGNKVGITTLALLWLAVVSAGCTNRQQSDADPRKRVTDYISKSFAVREESDREGLMEQLTGDAKYRLAAWSDDQFRAAFIESKRTFVNLQFHDVKQVTESRYDITYDLVYWDGGRAPEKTDASIEDALAKVTQRKLAQVVNDRGKWLIADVRSIKELVEYKGEMSLP